MSAPFTGGCACGAIRYKCSAEPVIAYNCHCHACQRATGSAFLAMLWVPGASLTLTKGDPQYHTETADSGNTLSRGFCAKCGAPVCANASRLPEYVSLIATSLDDPTLFQPMADYWIGSAQPWDYMNPELPKFQKGARPCLRNSTA